MIKMNYGNAKHLTQLKEDYPKIFKGVSRMQSRWAALRKKLVKKDAEFKRLLPAKVDELLVMDFEGLADIYEKYIGQVLEEEIVDDAKSLFAYERHKDRYDVTWTGLRSKIVEFMLDKKNGFDIHTCHYCDMAYINVFEVGKKKKTQIWTMCWIRGDARFWHCRSLILCRLVRYVMVIASRVEGCCILMPD